MRRFSQFSIAALMLTVISLGPYAQARRVVGLWIGSGMAWPIGDFKMDAGMGGDAKMGGKIGIGIDVYAVENLAIGVFGNFDVMSAGEKALIQPSEIYGYEQSPVKVSNYAVGEAGGMAKYFLSGNPRLEPYGKLWLGYSETEVDTDEPGGGGGKGSIAYGFGAGVMWRLLNQIRLTTDLNYNVSKMDKSDTKKNSSRINLGIAFNFLFGS